MLGRRVPVLKALTIVKCHAVTVFKGLTSALHPPASAMRNGMSNLGELSNGPIRLKPMLFGSLAELLLCYLLMLLVCMFLFDILERGLH